MSKSTSGKQHCIMREYGIPNKIIGMVKIFYEDFECAERIKGKYVIGSV